MNKTYKLGSLFDGSGGFPLAGALCGIEPVWASEVEPYPIAVTKSRFPTMKHLGDISKINGAEIEPVDIITFGSPCQDLSVAGKRAGLKHEDNGDDETTRSGLFIEAVRIIKEMREKTNGEYPRFAVWENVPGAFSSNKGEDFRIVLEEMVKIAEPTAVMPPVPQFGWAYADSYCGDGWSLAYRVLDAQYWGVPQRRRRIYLVADFRGGCAREILFEREGLRGYFTQGGTPWKAVAPDAERGIGADDNEGEVPYTLKIRSGVSVDSYGKAAGKGALIQKNLSATLGVSQDQYLFQPVGVDVYNTTVTGDVACPLTAEGHTSTGTCPKVMIPVTVEPGIAAREGGHTYEGVSGTLRANAGDNQMSVAYGISAYESNAMKSGNPHSGIYEADTSRTLDLNGGNPACNQGGIAIVEAVTDRNILDDQGGSQISVRDDGKCPTLRAEMHGNVPCVMDTDGVAPPTVYAVENHPADSRVDIDESGTVQTLTGRMGTGGGNVPMVMEAVPNGTCPGHHDGVVIAEQPIAVDRAFFNQGQNALYDPQTYEDGTNPTLVAKGPSAVRYKDTYQRTTGPLMANSHPGSYSGQDAYQDMFVVGKNPHDTACGINGDVAGTLDASYYKGCGMRQGTEREVVVHPTRYIVRRLTPTECARLQGFADRWGDIDPKTKLTDEEYRFWLEVRKTSDVINGRAEKDYTEKQILTWYNKLPTDSAEYKMWGNGIALPTALYVIQGVADAMKGERT